MASTNTSTVTLPSRTSNSSAPSGRHANKNHKPKQENLPPENERFLKACTDIANALIQDYEAQQKNLKEGKPLRDLNLNALRSQVSRKYRLTNMPTLSSIIAAIPEHWKKYLLPKLVAKPIRKIHLRHM
jgi:elongator complex protein 3